MPIHWTNPTTFVIRLRRPFSAPAYLGTWPGQAPRSVVDGEPTDYRYAWAFDRLDEAEAAAARARARVCPTAYVITTDEARALQRQIAGLP